MGLLQDIRHGRRCIQNFIELFVSALEKSVLSLIWGPGSSQKVCPKHYVRTLNITWPVRASHFLCFKNNAPPRAQTLAIPSTPCEGGRSWEISIPGTSLSSPDHVTMPSGSWSPRSNVAWGASNGRIWWPMHAPAAGWEAC